MMSLYKIGKGDVIMLVHSYDSPEELVWKKKNNKEDYYDSPGRWYDDPVKTDTVNVEYDSTTTGTIELAPPPMAIEEPVAVQTTPDEEYLLDTFVATGILPFVGDVLLPYEKVTLVFSKDSSYTLTYNGKTEKGRFKFYLNRSAIALNGTTTGTKYCPLYISWDYSSGRRMGIQTITVTLGLPGEKELRRVVMEEHSKVKK
jgi:hypothetical protein